MLQHTVGRAVVKHGLELVNRLDHDHEKRVLEPNMSHLDQEVMLQSSQVMVQQLVE